MLLSFDKDFQVIKVVLAYLLSRMKVIQPSRLAMPR